MSLAEDLLSEAKAPRINSSQAAEVVQCKQEQRLRALTRIAEDDASTWTEADCLLELTLAKFRGRFEERDAWR